MLHHTAARLHWQHPASFCGVFAFLPCRKFFRRGHRIRLRRRLCGLSGGARNACAPVRHSQKHLAPMAQFGFFLCPRSCRWSTQRVRPRSALAKAAVLRTVFFSFAHPFCALRAEVWAKEKQPLARLLLLVCSLVPVVGLEPTRILLHRILSPARLPVSPHRRR